jgi:hypothetical protein
MTAANSTVTTLDSDLKAIYKPQNYRLSTYEKRPMFALIPKDETFGGKNMPLVNRYGNPQGVSAAFSTAQGNYTSMKLGGFTLTRVTEYSVSGIDGEAIEASESDKYAFFEALTAQIDSSMDSLMDTIESYIPRSGDGAIGIVSSGSTVSSGTITLSDAADAHNFEVGMTLVEASSATAALGTGTEVLKGINRATGDLLSTSTTWATVLSSLATGHYLFRQGDAYNNVSNKVLSGFSGWIPSTAPVAGTDSWFGQDRSYDSRLYGNYYDGSAGSIEEALINGQSYGSQVGGKIDTYFINHTKFRRFKMELGTKEWFAKNAQTPDGETAEVNFQAIRIQGDDGPIGVVAANKCQGTKAWGLQMDTWLLATLGAAPKLLDYDGLTILRQSSADGYEVRVGIRGQIGCKKPGSNVQVLLPS